MPKNLQQKVDAMPRQAVYALATRNCNAKEKTQIVEQYKGETKKELLEMIRQRFPLADKDKRAPNLTDQVFSLIKQLEKQMANPRFKPSPTKAKQIQEALSLLLNKT